MNKEKSFWTSAKPNKRIKTINLFGYNKNPKPSYNNYIKPKSPISPVKLNIYPVRTKTEVRLIDRKPWSDSDKDKVPNIFDCKPLNKHKQSKMFGKKIEKDIMAPNRIIKYSSKKSLNVNFPSKQQLEEEIKLQKAESKTVPPSYRRNIMSKRQLIKIFQKNPDLYTKVKNEGYVVQFHNIFDAVKGNLKNDVNSKERKPFITRSLGYTNRALRTVSINPIRDNSEYSTESTPLHTIKHEIAHFTEDTEEGAEREARRPLARDIAKQEYKEKGPQAQLLKYLSDKEQKKKKGLFSDKRGKWTTWLDKKTGKVKEKFVIENDKDLEDWYNMNYGVHDDMIDLDEEDKSDKPATLVEDKGARLFPRRNRKKKEDKNKKDKEDIDRIIKGAYEGKLDLDKLEKDLGPMKKINPKAAKEMDLVMKGLREAQRAGKEKKIYGPLGKPTIPSIVREARRSEVNAYDLDEHLVKAFIDAEGEVTGEIGYKPESAIETVRQRKALMKNYDIDIEKINKPKPILPKIVDEAMKTGWKDFPKEQIDIRAFLDAEGEVMAKEKYNPEASVRALKMRKEMMKEYNVESQFDLKEEPLNSVQNLRDQEASQDIVEDMIEEKPSKSSIVSDALSSMESMPDIKESMEKSAQDLIDETE